MALGDNPFQNVITDISSVIGLQGYDVLLFQSVSCPCGSTPNGANNINCAACGGYGLLYPNAPITMYAMVSDAEQTLEMQQDGFGLAQYGDIVIYPTPGIARVNTFDMFVLPSTIAFPTYSEMMTRGFGNTDTTDYNVVQADGAWTVDPVSGNSTMYKPNVDFTFNGKTITWIGNKPQTEQVYSLRYGAQFEWLVFNPPTPRLAFGQDLGQIVSLRKRHIVLPNGPSLQIVNGMYYVNQG